VVGAAGVATLATALVAVPLAQSAPATRAQLLDPEASVQHATLTVPVAHVRRAARPGTVTARAGDTLWKIAGRACGNPRDYLALALNNRVRNPDVILAGEVFRVACQAAASAVAAAYPPPRPRRSLPVSSPVSTDTAAVHPATVHPVARQAAVVTATGRFGCAALEALWQGAVGAPGEAFTAAEIAMAESGGNPGAVSPTDDFGLWQVNASNGALATLSPAGSARSAVILSRDGADWSPWTTFTSGAYRGQC
jgi:hypothetical protein